LRIAQWNANGLQRQEEEVKLFLYQNKIDILLISERTSQPKITSPFPATTSASPVTQMEQPKGGQKYS
jgi:exonuclease III